MYYGRKKSIIILVILIILIILLGAGGFAIAYFTTDLFKPNDVMFFKYLGQSIEDLQFTDNLQISSIEQLQKQMPYTVDGSVGVTVEGATSYGLNALNNTKIVYNGKVDPVNEKVYAKADLKSNNESVFSIEYANSNNIFALKSDEIVTAFIGIENKDINLMSQKMGLPVQDVPEEIGNQDIGNAIKFTDAEKKHILELFANVVKENVPSSAFTKESNIATKRDGITYDTTGYRLNLTYDQLRKLEVALLNATRQDNVTLNIIATKASQLGLGEEYTDVTNLSGKLNEMIGKIQSSTKIGDDLSIIVYVSNGEVITTEIIQKNVAKYTISCEKSDTGVKRDLLIENLDIDAKYNTLNITMTDNNTATLSYINLTVTIDDEKTFNFSINNEGSAAQEYLNSTIDASYSENGGSTIAFNATQKLQFVEELTDIIELNRNNCGVLNDYTDEQVQTLITSIINRAQEVFNEKIQKLGINFSDNSTVTPVLNDVLKEQEMQAFNAKFEVFKGKISGTSLNQLNTLVKKNNEDSKNKTIILTVDGVNTAGDTKTIEASKSYDVVMQYNNEGYIYEITAVEYTENIISQSKANADLYREAAAREMQELNNNH